MKDERTIRKSGQWTSCAWHTIQIDGRATRTHKYCTDTEINCFVLRFFVKLTRRDALLHSLNAADLQVGLQASGPAVRVHVSGLRLFAVGAMGISGSHSLFFKRMCYRIMLRSASRSRISGSAWMQDWATK